MTKPTDAIILCAGKGTRMQPLTDTMPKPMVEVDGVKIVDHIIDHCKKDGINHIAINLHHFGVKLENHLKNREDIKISFSKEPSLLDTGGGVRKASRLFNSDDPFYIINGDAYWTDAPDTTTLKQLADMWDPDKMDILILLQKVEDMTLTSGVGDYDIQDDGKAIRSHDKSGGYMFTSLRIMKPQALRGTPEGPFSYLELMDRAEQQGRLYALVHKGQWHHISTPEDVESVSNALKQEGAA